MNNHSSFLKNKTKQSVCSGSKPTSHLEHQSLPKECFGRYPAGEAPITCILVSGCGIERRNCDWCLLVQQGKLPLSLRELLLWRWILSKKRPNPIWKKTFGILNEKVQSSGVHDASSGQLPICHRSGDKAKSMSVKICLFYASTSFSLSVCFPLILFPSIFLRIKHILFYVFLQQLNQGRQCAKVNKHITRPSEIFSYSQLHFKLKTTAVFIWMWLIQISDYRC